MEEEVGGPPGRPPEEEGERRRPPESLPPSSFVLAIVPAATGGGSRRAEIWGLGEAARVRAQAVRVMARRGNHGCSPPRSPPLPVGFSTSLSSLCPRSPALRPRSLAHPRIATPPPPPPTSDNHDCSPSQPTIATQTPPIATPSSSLSSLRRLSPSQPSIATDSGCSRRKRRRISASEMSEIVERLRRRPETEAPEIC